MGHVIQVVRTPSAADAAPDYACSGVRLDSTWRVSGVL